MASPQIEDGFVMTAVELFAALLVANLPKYQDVILAEMILASYGVHKHKTHFINHLQIARTMLVDPRIIRRALGDLEAGGVIKLNADGSHSFVKNWERWLMDPPKGSPSIAKVPRIGLGETAFIDSCKARFGTKNPSNSKQNTGTKQSPPIHENPGTHQGTPGTNESLLDGFKGTNESLLDGFKGTNESPESEANSRENLDANPNPATDFVPPLAGACPPASEEFRKRLDIGGSEYSPPPKGGSGVEIELDRLRDEFFRLTEDANLAACFREQIVDWFNGGMTTADVREALMIARSKNVQPASVVGFVASASKRVLRDRLRDERIDRGSPRGPMAIAQPPAPRVNRHEEQTGKILASLNYLKNRKESDHG